MARSRLFTVLDESGQPAGVIAIVIETTEKVAAATLAVGRARPPAADVRTGTRFHGHAVACSSAVGNQVVPCWIGTGSMTLSACRSASPEVEGQGFFEFARPGFHLLVPSSATR